MGMKQRRTNPRNRYAERAPEFAALASVYPSLAKLVKYGARGKASINWADYDATRELTRVLLDHDYGIKWWIPDGHLCPTVTNRANYIHWIQDLLDDFPSSGASERREGVRGVRGVDIGTGANCIYPLLGASVCGWSFVATDVTSVALEWAAKNVQDNPQVANLIEIRNAAAEDSLVQGSDFEGVEIGRIVSGNENSRLDSASLSGNSSYSTGNEHSGRDSFKTEGNLSRDSGEGNSGRDSFKADGNLSGPEGNLGRDSFKADGILSQPDSGEEKTKADGSLSGPDSGLVEIVKPRNKLLLGVLNDDEEFDFCMCNPPFFESMEEAGLNPRTACGGTKEEMVCPGGEAAFVTRLIQESVQLGRRIHWYTTMVGKKASLKSLTSELRTRGVTMLRTTEFVQGRTSRWGLAWSFSPSPQRPTMVVSGKDSSKASFMLEGLGKQSNACDVLQSLASHLQAFGATCEVDRALFSISGCLRTEEAPSGKRSRNGDALLPEQGRKAEQPLKFTVNVFQQAPGCLLVKSSSFPSQAASTIRFLSMVESAEAALKQEFSSRARQRTR